MSVLPAPLRLIPLLCLLLLVACGGSSSPASGEGPQPSPVETPRPSPTAPSPVPTTEPSCEADYESTFEAVSELIFVRHDCTNAACHGSAAVGGLDLRPGEAWGNLVDVPSLGASLARVVPGDRERSYLFRKVLAKVDPEAVEINGSPMPTGPTALSEQELALLRLWIVGGAPQTGVVEGTAELLDSCLPAPEPVSIEPLAPPAPDEGVQFVLPPIQLPAAGEQEYCFAIWFDFRDVVPEAMKDPSGEFFYINAQELRQDPMSHHLVLFYADGLGPEDLDDPLFGGWTCAGGADEGAECDPVEPGVCGEGHCRSKPTPSFACLGFGPAGIDPVGGQLAGAQESNAYLKLHEGVYGQLPLRGVAYVNSHAFNLTPRDHELNGRVNIYFADDRRFPVVPLVGGGGTFRPATPPYEAEDICGRTTLPEGARLFAMSSHNHKRGKYFWAELPSGERIYESSTYSDPTKQRFDPPLEFDSPDPADRTIDYCAHFVNGVDEVGNPDPETVTRASRMPQAAIDRGYGCTPVACAAGSVGEACSEDRDCDSTPGAGDGLCDACPIVGGITTENEMFILLGQYFMGEGYPQPDIEGMVSAGVASVPQAAQAARDESP